MSCSNLDLKGYFLGEASNEERRAVEQHLPSCATCREELDRLRLTQTALFTLRDEELPRRIAFVSDKVFEPRWYQRLWHSGPQLGFLSALMLACSILVHAFYQPAPATVATAPQPAIARAEIEAVLQTEMNRRMEMVLTKALAESEARQEKLTTAKLAAAVERFELDRAEDRANLYVFSNKLNNLLKNSVKYDTASLGGVQ